MLKKRKNPRPKKIFNQLLLTSSITIIATVSVLIVMTTAYYSDVIIKSEITQVTESLERADDYFIEREDEVTQIIRELYSDTSLVNDLAYALYNDYEEYYKYRLDRYLDNVGFMPIDFNSFFDSFFYNNPEVIAYTLRSSDTFPPMEYQYIYDYGQWNESVVEKITENSFICDVGTSYFKNIFTVNRPVNNPGTYTNMGCLTIYFSTDQLDNIFKKNEPDKKSMNFLLNDKGEILYTTHEDASENMVYDFSQEGLEKNEWNGSTYYVNKITGKNNYVYLGIIPKSSINKLTFAKGSMWALIAFSTLMAIFITHSFMKNYSARIDYINESMYEVEKGNLDIRIQKSNKYDELTTISDSFNSMLAELNDYIDRFYVADIKQQQAELRALQSQINPHFLFNTLEVIRMAAVIEGAKTSSQMIYHLSRLFRYTLESKEMVPLHVELEHTNQYLQLMQLQHPDKLTVSIDIPADIENTLIQKLIMQPIIENYMMHGFKKDRQDNFLKITANEENDKINVYVVDNGQGISEERLTEILHHLTDEKDTLASIGLKNVHQRLQLKYGQDYGLTIQSEEDVETIVTISIPIL